jgi:hypothetical protein
MTDLNKLLKRAQDEMDAENAKWKAARAREQKLENRPPDVILRARQLAAKGTGLV